MDSIAAAISTAAAVSTIGSHFMLDGNTYKRGAELGFQGLDFYVTGRGGVLGDVDADVVSAAFTFFEPGGIRTLWDQGRAVMPAASAASEFASCCATWAEEHVPDTIDAAVISAGLTPLEALSVKTPQMLALFGWSEPAEVDGLRSVWESAEEHTNRAYAGLSDAERAELADLANALHAATTG